MNQIGKALADSVGYINLGLAFIFGGLFIISMLNEQQVNSSVLLALAVIIAISSPIIIFGIKRFNHYKVYFKADHESRRLMYAEVVPNVLGFVLMGIGLSFLFTYRTSSAPDGRLSIFLQPYATYAAIMILIGCGLTLLALKFYRDFIPKQIVHETKINT